MQSIGPKIYLDTFEHLKIYEFSCTHNKYKRGISKQMMIFSEITSH